MVKNKYSETINKYIELLKENIRDNLDMIYIIGSSATKDVIVGWSDIDCILVLKYYNYNDIEIIKELSNSFEIKIGNTIYSKLEFEKGLVDPKTYYYLLLNKEKILDIQYLDSDLLIPNVSVNNCKKITEVILFNDLHNCKRLLIYPKLNKAQIKTLFKKIYVIMKSILIINGKRPKNYKETFNMFSEIFEFDYFDYEHFIDEYRNEEIDEKRIKSYAFKLIIFVINILAG